jgi:ABC-2 type transport system permease protein
MQTLRTYFHYIAAGFRGQAQYPASLIMLVIGQFLSTTIEVAGVWAMFQRFGHIQGWGYGEVAVFYGQVSMTFAVADMVWRGFDVFGVSFVKTGEFDRVLVRPRTAAFQLLGYQVRLSPLGRILQGAIIFGIGAAETHMAFTPATVAILFWAFCGGVVLFGGLLILQATLSFWTVESLEVANVLTYGGVQAAQYPLGVYAAWFRNILIYAVPIGCISYFPVVAALGRHDPLGAPDWFLPVSPVMGFVFLGVSLWVWGFGVRRYTSTGS